MDWSRPDRVHPGYGKEPELRPRRRLCTMCRQKTFFP